MKKKVCIVTGSRAEYGACFTIMREIKKDPDLELKLIVTGMHLSPYHGSTFQIIEQEGFAIDKKVEMLLSTESPASTVKSTAIGMIGLVDVFKELNPSIVLIIGDRFEIFAAAFSAAMLNIPIAHLSGGELTIGSTDEFIRHSITKMSWWHFVTTEEYKRRVVQLGENPERVFCVGALGIDRLKTTNLLSKNQLEENIGFTFGKKNLLITFHPVTLEHDLSEKYFRELINALNSLNKIKLIFTSANADAHGSIINKIIDEFVLNNQDRSIKINSLGSINFLSTLQFIDGMVGNSSSGLVEAPSFKIGTVNIGNRQKGRVKPDSVINCDPNEKSILRAINKLYSRDLKKRLKTIKNPYGNGNASQKILQVLKTTRIPKSIQKDFFDL